MAAPLPNGNGAAIWTANVEENQQNFAFHHEILRITSLVINSKRSVAIYLPRNA